MANGHRQGVNGGVLDDNILDASRERLAALRLAGRVRQADEVDAGVGGAQPPDAFVPAGFQRLEIDEDDMRPVDGAQLDGFAAGTDLGDEPKVWECPEEQQESAVNGVLILDDQYTNNFRHDYSLGRVKITLRVG